MEKLKVQDLRIGNYVKAVWEDSETGEEKSINTQISGLDINGELGEGWYFMVELSDPEQDWFSDIKGIPFDKEWQIKLGCKAPTKDDPYGGMIYQLNQTSALRIRDNSWSWSGYDDGSIELKYVHQFQNLIHVLTGADIK